MTQHWLLFFVFAAIGFQTSTTLAAAPVKDWTMMVFLNGNSNLDSFGALNINQMEKSGSNEKRNIVVQWASLAEKTTKRLYITKDQDDSKIASPIVETLNDVDMGSKQSLMDFIAWTAKNYPAKKYFIVVWNHGGGWHFAPNGEILHPTDISWDDKTGHRITTEELADVMRESAKLFGHKVDLYGSDACLMSMVEVAHQMRGAVETFVGSEETEPGAGWPYDKFLKAWDQNPRAGSLEVGKMLTDAYAELYKDETGQSTFSTIEMAKLPKLVRAMKHLGLALKANSNKKDLVKESTKAVRFYSYDYVDITSVVGGLKPLAQDSATRAALNEVERSVRDTVYHNRTNTKAGGLSVWWPVDGSDWGTYADRYEKLDFNRATDWHSFLKSLF